MTMPPLNIAPMTNPATTISHTCASSPKTTNGMQPTPHSRFMIVR